MRRAATDLFIRREGDPHDAMRNGGVRHEVLRRRDDFGDARLVVGSQERRSGPRHDVVADLRRQRGIVGETQHRRVIIGEDEIPSVVLTMHERLDAGAAHFRRRVHVSDEPDRRHRRLACRRRDGSRHVAVRVHGRVGEPQLAQLGGQISQQHELLVGTRISRRALVGLRVVPHVAQEAIKN